MNFNLYLSLILLVNKKILALQTSTIPDSHFVKKGIGERDNIIEEYHTCVQEKTDFIFYDIDLYTNEYLEISCGKDLDLEPLKDDKYFEKSDYVNNLGGPYERLDFKDTKPFSTLTYDIVTKYYPKGKYWRIYNKGNKDKGDLKTIYLHCYKSNKTVNSTIQINLIGDWKLLKKENEFVFDKYEFSSAGKNLTYIKSMRLGTLTRTKCKDSKLSIKYKVDNPTLKRGYTPYKLLSSSKVQFIDITKEILEIKEGVHTIDLRESNRTLLDLERCQAILTCEKHNDRKLIYVYPKYDELPGLNPKSEDASDLAKDGSGGVMYSFTIETLTDKIFSFHVPKGSKLFPPLSPNDVSYWRSNYPENFVNNFKTTEIAEGVSIVDTSSIFTRITITPNCTISSGTGSDDKIGMSIDINPTCNISNKEETISNYHCVLYGKTNGYVVIKSSEKDKSRLKFLEKVYTRDYSKGVGTNDIWYKESFKKLKPKITKVNETEVYIKINYEIDENPLYFITSNKDESSIKNPNSVVEIHLADSYGKPASNRDIHVYNQVRWKPIFYTVYLKDQPLEINCGNFLIYNSERPSRPYIYPKEDNKIFINVPNGKVDPRTLNPVSITDHFGVSGAKFITTSEHSDLKIEVQNPFIYSDHMKPFYYICVYNSDNITTRGTVDPYAVIQIVPLYKKIGDEQCGIKNSLNDKPDKIIPCNVRIKSHEDKFGYFCPTFLDIPEPDSYQPKSVKIQGPSKNQMECKYGKHEANTTVGENEFYDLIYPEGKDYSGTSLIFISSETPIFKNNKGNVIKCTCKGRKPITVHIDENLLGVGSSKDGFFGINFAIPIFSLLIASIFSI